MEISMMAPTRPMGRATVHDATTALSRTRLTSTANDTLPKSLIYLAQSVQWDPGDRAVRRFSDPAVDSSRQRLAAQIVTARTAYAKAFVSIQQSYKNVDVKGLLLHSTEEDVAQMARQLGANTAAQEQGALDGLVNVLHYYHDVFDVLSQGDFSFLPIIWGGMKMMLVLAKNRGELIEKIANMLIEVGMSLSRIEVYCKLYPTERMLKLTSDLYAAVIDFLQEIITTYQRSAVRKLFSSMVRPFDEKYGRLVERIRRLENDIQKDGFLLQALQTASIAHHHLDSYLQRQQVHEVFKGIPHDDLNILLGKIKDTLFIGYEHQASYHESLSSTYSVTAGPAWEKWFKKEQRYLPSAKGPRTRLVQGLCDAPDFQHALQWSEQQRTESPEIPSAFLIWAKGMTAHSAVASLIFQILQQRPEVVAEHSLDVEAFRRANSSIKKLWDIFVHLMKVLGGCLIYISIGSVGDDEFAVVDKFIQTIRDWDGPVIRVTIVHPYHQKFTLIDEATEIDGAYDVHPSLTTSDALHHVLMLELGVRDVSETIQTVLWESLWRETRYAVIGVALEQLLADVRRIAAGEISAALTDDETGVWLAGVQGWSHDDVSTNNVREIIQRHLDIVALEPTDEIRSQLTKHAKLIVFKADTHTQPVEALADRPLTQPQRDHIWDRMQAAIRPGTHQMFGGGVENAIQEVLERWKDLSPGIGLDVRQAGKTVRRLFDREFSRDGSWKAEVSDDGALIVEAIRMAIITGFEDVIQALLGGQDHAARPQDDDIAPDCV